MNTMTYKGYGARVEYDDEDGIFVGHLAGIDDIVAFHGDTVDGLKAAFREAVDDYLATCAKIGKAPEKAYSGQLMVRIAPAVHARAARAAELAGKSLSQWTEAALEEKATEGMSVRRQGVGRSPERLAAGRGRTSVTARKPKRRGSSG
jgi:predicted HicB family RNase H-like nuclease